MRKELTAEEVVEQLWGHIRPSCNQSQLAKRIGVSLPFVNDILHGKRAPSGKVLDFLGLERVVTYKWVPRNWPTQGKEVKP